MESTVSIKIYPYNSHIRKVALTYALDQKQSSIERIY